MVIDSMWRVIGGWAAVVLCGAGSARAGEPGAGEMLRRLENLRVAGSVLYVAAHPDDENTRLIAWLVGQRGVRTAYLSLTRGDGGQNLIGPEQAELLGVIRTGELLAARAVDGGEQRFTRVRDFGYSKSAEETLALWGHDEALDDVVRAIRGFRPDVVITRFPTTGETHGHHLASARLAAEAFTLAGDPAYVTDGLSPWSPDRLLQNVSTWNLPKDADLSEYLTLDVGSFDPRTGRSVGEVAAISRSNHKSQGFGSAPSVGPAVEAFASLAGTPVGPGDDLFEGLDLGWSRFEGTKPLVKALDRAVDRYDARRPYASAPALAQVHALLEAVPDTGWRDHETAVVERWLVDATGLWLTARAERDAVAPGGELTVKLTALARSPAAIELHEVAIGAGGVVDGAVLVPGEPWSAEVPVTVPADAPLTIPHWLVEPSTAARYTIADPAWRDVADTPASLIATFDLTIAGRRITVERPVEVSVTDPVLGERRQPVEVLPPVTATFEQPALVVPSGGQGTSRLTLRATSGPATGVLRLRAPAGVEVSPAELAFDLQGERVVEVRVTVGAGAAAGALAAEVVVGDRTTGHQQAVVDHPHLPRRSVLTPARQAIVPLALDRGGVTRIGYITGPGDGVPAALRAAGYTVEELDEDAIASGDLARYDAIVAGIRAYNTRPRLLAQHDRLMAYVAAGGRYVVQYNTNNRFDPLDGPIGPAPFAIGRDRVTDEAAPVTPVDPAHPAWSGPNALGPADFEGWVQERGLYFATSWDPAYQPVFAMADPGEEPRLGNTLVARHGEGVFVYTGLAFFRQLPAGVPGSYRLFANLLAL